MPAWKAAIDVNICAVLYNILLQLYGELFPSGPLAPLLAAYGLSLTQDQLYEYHLKFHDN